MNQSAFLISLTLALGGFVSSPRAAAEDWPAKGREILKKNQASVVTVQLVVKSKMGFAGGGSEGRESKQEVTGTVIDPSGLTAVSLTSTDPSSLMQSFMGGLGGDGEENIKLKMESELSDVKLLLQDGTEVPAEIVLRDKDLDLAFVRPKAKPAAPLAAVDLANNAKVGVLDEVLTINRLGVVAGRAYAASIERINAIVEKPRLFYVPGSDKTATGLGCPAFNADGKIVGLFLMRAVKAGGGANPFSMQSPFISIILPAEAVRKVAAQAAAPKDDQK